jgi:hypothetical protein
MKKALYEAKTITRTVNKRIDSLLQQGYSKCVIECGVCVRVKNKAKMLFVCLHVDETLVIENDLNDTKEFKI